MMLRGLWRLTWIEMKIFFREPLGVIGAVFIPILVVVLFGRMGAQVVPQGRTGAMSVLRVDVPVLAAVLIAVNAVLSLVSTISIYREGGILKRLRATPLRPATILTAHVLVKLFLTAAAFAVTLMAGKRFFSIEADVPVIGFAVALLISTWSILAIGFLIASVVPIARFAQPVGAFVLYPMLSLSGMFVPVEVLRPELRAIARAVPLTYSVSLLRGIWNGDTWSAHTGDIAALVLVFIVCTALSAKVFRWE